VPFPSAQRDHPWCSWSRSAVTPGRRRGLCVRVEPLARLVPCADDVKNFKKTRGFSIFDYYGASGIREMAANAQSVKSLEIDPLMDAALNIVLKDASPDRWLIVQEQLPELLDGMRWAGWAGREAPTLTPGGGPPSRNAWHLPPRLTDFLESGCEHLRGRGENSQVSAPSRKRVAPTGAPTGHLQGRRLYPTPAAPTPEHYHQTFQPLSLYLPVPAFEGGP
jgi:hypothetical protein